MERNIIVYQAVKLLFFDRENNDIVNVNTILNA